MYNIRDLIKVTDYSSDDRGFDSWKIRDFLFATTSKPTLWPPSLLYNGDKSVGA